MNAPEPALLPAPLLRRLTAVLPAPGEAPVFLLEQHVVPADPRRVAGVVAASAAAGEIRQLLRAGVRRVYVGEAALLDGALVGQLAAEFGPERVGVCVSVKRMRVSWSMDTVSNADFRVMTPSVCEPCWEILRADGARSGTQAAWWLGEMFAQGAGAALVRVDIADDADLNILAGLAERWGERLWVASLDEAAPDFQAWVGLAGVRQLAVPDAAWQQSPSLAAWREAQPQGEEIV